MVWIAARNRLTGDIEALGLWSGEDTETITVTDMWTGAPATRVFHGAGSLLGISAVQHEAGLSVRPVRLSLSAMDAAVIDAVRVYDPRGARVQVWRRTLSPETGLQVGSPSPGSRASATGRRSRARCPAARRSSRWRWSRPRGC